MPGASGTITILSAQFLAYDCGNASLSADKLISMTGLIERGFSTPIANPLESASLSYEGDSLRRESASAPASFFSVSICCTRSALATSFLGITILIAPLVFERRAHKIQSIHIMGSFRKMCQIRVLRIFNAHSGLFALRF